MNPLSRPFNNRLIRVLAIAIPSALALALCILQYGWITRAAVTQEQRILESTMLDARRAVESSFDDLRLAVSIVHTALGIGSGSDEVIEQALTGWYHQTSFHSLIRGVWLLSGADAQSIRAEHITIDPGSGKLQALTVPTGTLPAQLMPVAEELAHILSDPGSPGTDLRMELGNEGYIQVLPNPGSARASGTMTLAILAVNTDTYLNETLPFYLRRELPGYSYSVHPASDFPPLPPQLPTQRTGGGRHRFLFLTVPGFWYAVMPGATLDTLTSAPSAPSSSAGGGDAPRGDKVGYISLEYSSGRWSHGVESWIVLNMAASGGIILLLLAALVAALLLFSRTRELRTAEMEFVASISHELRLPITVIRVIADNLAAGIVRDGARMEKYGDQIRHQTTRLSSMVEGMLLSAGLQGEGTRPNVTRFDPCDAATRIVEELTTIADEHGAAVVIGCEDAGQFEGAANLADAGDAGEPLPDVEPRGAGSVWGDADGFSLVIRNLVMNAIVHALPSPAGESRRVCVRVVQEPTCFLRLEVSDNGPGIPRKEQKSVFEPFARTTRSLTEQHRGTGLGLHIASKVVRMNDGAISLFSPYRDSGGQIRRGCRFVATMKYRQAHRDA